MLKYIVTVTDDLLIVSTLVGLLCAYCFGRWRGAKVYLVTGAAAGFAASVAMAIVKNTTKLIYTNQWNFWIFIVTIVVSLAFIICQPVFRKGRRSGISGIIICSLTAAIISLLFFYEIPDVLAYPFLFDTGGNGVLSVNFLVRLIGWALAIILSYVYIRYVYRCAMALNGRLLLAIMDIGLLVNVLRCLGQAFRPWLTRAKWLPGFLPRYVKADHPWAFPFTAFVANNTLLFSIVIAGVALVIPIVLFIHNIKVTGQYANPAQHRKLKSICIRGRRHAVTVGVCFTLAVVSLTAVKAYDSRVIELSPPEPYTITDDVITIPLTQLDDGHLHRFEYADMNDIKIRWIIIRKPGSGAYGVGLDACEVCGDAGYYERGGQVVCKRCDVVMNINTIGFRGGCNPIPLEYSVAGGQLVIPLQAVIDGGKEFR